MSDLRGNEEAVIRQQLANASEAAYSTRIDSIMSCLRKGVITRDEASELRKQAHLLHLMEVKAIYDDVRECARAS